MTYGIIKTKSGRTYVSPIFALKYVGWKSEAVALDETFSKIIRIKLHDTGFAGIGRTGRLHKSNKISLHQTHRQYYCQHISAQGRGPDHFGGKDLGDRKK